MNGVGVVFRSLRHAVWLLCLPTLSQSGLRRGGDRARHSTSAMFPFWHGPVVAGLKTHDASLIERVCMAVGRRNSEVQKNKQTWRRLGDAGQICSHCVLSELDRYRESRVGWTAMAALGFFRRRTNAMAPRRGDESCESGSLCSLSCCCAPFLY